MTISIFDYCSQIVIGRYEQVSVVSLWVCESSSSFHFVQQVGYALFGDRVAGLLERSFRRHGKAVIWNAVLTFDKNIILTFVGHGISVLDLKFFFLKRMLYIWIATMSYFSFSNVWDFFQSF